MKRWVMAIVLVAVACIPAMTSSARSDSLNSPLCAAAAFALLWFTYELSGALPFAALCAALFGLWLSDAGPVLAPLGLALSAVILFAALHRHRVRFFIHLPGALAALWLSTELEGLTSLKAAMADPASGPAILATGLSLASLASYARYERLRAADAGLRSTALDVPATRNSVQRSTAKAPGWLWPALSLTACCLGTQVDSQVVALPALLFGVAIAFRSRNHAVRLTTPLAAAILVPLCLIIGHGGSPPIHRINTEVLVAWAYPSLSGHASAIPWLLFVGLVGFVANGAAYLLCRQNGALAYSGLAMSVLAAAVATAAGGPLIGPAAFRAIFVASLGSACLLALVSAASRPAVQAPPRRVPAPGSLLRP